MENKLQSLIRLHMIGKKLNKSFLYCRRCNDCRSRWSYSSSNRSTNTGAWRYVYCTVCFHSTVKHSDAIVQSIGQCVSKCATSSFLPLTKPNAMKLFLNVFCTTSRTCCSTRPILWIFVSSCTEQKHFTTYRYHVMSVMTPFSKQILTFLPCNDMLAQYELLSFVCVYVCRMPATTEMAPQIELFFAYAHVSVGFVHHWHRITWQIQIHSSMWNGPKRCYWLSLIRIIKKWKMVTLWHC